MIASKFIRFNKAVINIHDVRSIYFYDEKTTIRFIYRDGALTFDGDVRDELWGLIKLATEPKDTTDLERRITGVEDKIGKNFAEENREPDVRLIIGYTEDGTAVYQA